MYDCKNWDAKSYTIQTVIMYTYWFSDTNMMKLYRRKQEK